MIGSPKNFELSPISIDTWIAERMDLIIQKAGTLNQLEIMDRAHPGTVMHRLGMSHSELEAVCRGTILMIRTMRSKGRLFKTVHLLGAGVALIEIGGSLNLKSRHNQWKWGHFFEPKKLGDFLMTRLDTDLGFSNRLSLDCYLKLDRPVPLPELFLSWQKHFESTYGNP